MTDPELLTDLYRGMLLIRQVEERMVTKASQGLIPGFVHTYIGQEAVAVGVCAALEPEDQITSTHRSHGHVLAKGADPGRFLAEVYGRVDGYCRGKGGETHVAVPEVGVLTVTAIVGGGIPIAVGAALAARLEGSQRVVVCFFGDGATNTGSFHEGVNLAAVWDLPVVFVCENNGYAEYMATRDHHRAETLARRGSAYGIASESVDGNDVEVVLESARRAVERARTGGGPTLLEYVTYRIRGHYEGDVTGYQPEQEIADWKERDPLDMVRARLGEASLETLERDVQEQVEAAFAFAEASPMPELEEVLQGVYTDRVEEGWR